MSMGNSGNTTTASNAEVSNLLVQGFKAAKEGRRDEAYEVFCDVVRRDPNNELGWLYRAATTEDLSEAYVCLQRVLSINPANEKAQRGVERIQNRLSAESNRVNATAAGVEAVSADLNGVGAPASPSIEEKDVISGFNPGFSRAAATPDTSNQSTTRYAYQEAPSPFNPNQAPETGGEAASAPPPYRPDFGQLNGAGTPVRPLSGPGRLDFTYQPAGNSQASADGGYSSPNGAAENDEEMVDEPVYAPVAPTGRIGSQRDSTSSRRAALVGGLASARQRGRAAFGTETPTGLDDNGKRRSRQILLPLVALGVLLVIAALVLLLLTTLNKPNSDTNQAAISATSTSSSLSTTASNQAQPTTANASAITVPVVGVTTSTSRTTAAAPTAAVVATTAAPATTARAATTAAAATTNPPVATTAAPPPATPAPAAPPATTAVPNAPALPRAVVYVIKSGDNLTRIASQYSTSIAAIAAANPTVNINRIFAGNQIVIPVSRPDFRGKGGAILAPNETLQTLADRYKVSLDELARFNGLTNPSDAKPGDAILIP